MVVLALALCGVGQEGERVYAAEAVTLSEISTSVAVPANEKTKMKFTAPETGFYSAEVVDPRLIGPDDEDDGFAGTFTFDDADPDYMEDTEYSISEYREYTDDSHMYYKDYQYYGFQLTKGVTYDFMWDATDVERTENYMFSMNYMKTVISVETIKEPYFQNTHDEYPMDVDGLELRLHYAGDVTETVTADSKTFARNCYAHTEKIDYDAGSESKKGTLTAVIECQQNDALKMTYSYVYKVYDYLDMTFDPVDANRKSVMVNPGEIYEMAYVLAEDENGLTFKIEGENAKVFAIAPTGQIALEGSFGCANSSDMKKVSTTEKLLKGETYRISFGCSSRQASPTQVALVKCGKEDDANTVRLNTGTLNILRGKSATLKATVTIDYENVSAEDLEWESSDDEIVEVEDGVVTVVKAGKAVITVWAEEAFAKCTVIVTEPVPTNGKIYTYSSGKYKVTKSAKTGGTVAFVGPKKKTVKSCTIPETVKISGYTFNVTKIEKNAFSSCKKLKKLQ